jgi:hypothetical protein
MTAKEIMQALEAGKEIIKCTYYFTKGKKNKFGGNVVYKIDEQVIKSPQFDKLKEDVLIVKSSETLNTVTYKLKTE